MATKICPHCEEEHEGVCRDELAMRPEELDDEIKRLYNRAGGSDVSWDTSVDLQHDNCASLRKCHDRLTEVLRPVLAEAGKDA